MVNEKTYYDDFEDHDLYKYKIKFIKFTIIKYNIKVINKYELSCKTSSW